MLDDMKTIFLFTIYVPIIPQHILESNPTINAFCMKEYLKISKKLIFPPFNVYVYVLSSILPYF